jgi:hypothetical protein
MIDPVSIYDEIQTFLLALKHRRLDDGENVDVIIGETAATLLIIAHMMALKIGLSREDIMDHLERVSEGLSEHLN